MRQIRFDIKEVEVKACKTDKNYYYTKVDGIVEAVLIDNSNLITRSETLAKVKFSKDMYSHGYDIILNNLHDHEFGYLQIYLKMFMMILGNVKVEEGKELEFNYDNFSWIGDSHNESMMELYKAYEMGVEAKKLGVL